MSDWVLLSAYEGIASTWCVEKMHFWVNVLAFALESRVIHSLHSGMERHCCHGMFHTHKHTDTLKHTSGCHAVLHGAMITLSSTGPYTLIHLYNSLCWFPAHIHTHRKYTQYKNQWLTWWALWDTGRKRAHTDTHTNAHGAQWSCWQALPRQINLVYSLIWAQIAPPQAHTYTQI